MHTLRMYACQKIHTLRIKMTKMVLSWKLQIWNYLNFKAVKGPKIQGVSVIPYCILWRSNCYHFQNTTFKSSSTPLMFAEQVCFSCLKCTCLILVIYFSLFLCTGRQSNSVFHTSILICLFSYFNRGCVSSATTWLKSIRHFIDLLKTMLNAFQLADRVCFSHTWNQDTVKCLFLKRTFTMTEIFHMRMNIHLKTNIWNN